MVNKKSAQVLKKNSDFLELKKQGQRVWPSRWMLLQFYFIDSTEIHFGITASRKVANSVVRNRLKRWCRDYFRELAQSPLEYGVKINVVFKPIQEGFYRGLSHGEMVAALREGLSLIHKKSKNRVARSIEHVPHGGNHPSRG